MLTQAPLKIVDVSAVSSRMISRRQQLEPNRVELHAPQAEHPLQRHGKIATPLPVFCRKPTTEEDRHATMKYKSKRPTSNAERPILNSGETFRILYWMLDDCSRKLSELSVG